MTASGPTDEDAYYDALAASLQREQDDYQWYYGWRDWRVVATAAGEVRYRHTGGGEDPNHERGDLEIAIGDHVWKGRFYQCVDGSSSYDIAGVSAADNPYLDFPGQENAESFEAFVTFAAPLLMKEIDDAKP